MCLPTAVNIETALARLPDAVRRYAWLQNNLANMYVGSEFARRFNGFYRVRRPKSWQFQFYHLMREAQRNTALDFSALLEEMLARTGNVEASFVSKLLATIDPSRPVWDSIVLRCLQLTPPSRYESNRLRKVAHLYETLAAQMTAILACPAGQEAVRQFDTHFPSPPVKLTDTKKIDFLLWAGCRT